MKLLNLKELIFPSGKIKHPSMEEIRDMGWERDKAIVKWVGYGLLALGIAYITIYT